MRSATGLLCAAALCVGGSALPMAPAPAEATRDTAPAFLFVDRGVVSERPLGAEAMPGPVTKEAKNPLLVEDKAWDVRWDNTYITARYDHVMKKTRLW